MEFHLDNSIALLARMPDAFNALLRDLPDAWTSANEGEKTWTPADIVAHLLYTERVNWMPRARVIRAFGETQPFPPFKRTGHLDEQEGKSLVQILNAFAEARSISLAELRAWNLSPDDLEKRGQHPALGPTTLAQLLAAWTVHDLTHLHQLTRVLAHQYDQAVGPFRKFLGVLQCTGHSAPA
ncbi:MAG: DinB family protein [Terracidiphilus sp.]